ncbi:hypothetical protein LXL04_017604 [Taraxacum kok-saghyz]
MASSMGFLLSLTLLFAFVVVSFSADKNQETIDPSKKSGGANEKQVGAAKFGMGWGVGRGGGLGGNRGAGYGMGGGPDGGRGEGGGWGGVGPGVGGGGVGGMPGVGGGGGMPGGGGGGMPGIGGGGIPGFGAPGGAGTSGGWGGGGSPGWLGGGGGLPGWGRGPGFGGGRPGFGGGVPGFGGGGAGNKHEEKPEVRMKSKYVLPSLVWDGGWEGAEGCLVGLEVPAEEWEEVRTVVRVKVADGVELVPVVVVLVVFQGLVLQEVVPVVVEVDGEVVVARDGLVVDCLDWEAAALVGVVVRDGVAVALDLAVVGTSMKRRRSMKKVVIEDSGMHGDPIKRRQTFE